MQGEVVISKDGLRQKTVGPDMDRGVDSELE
jgi:hypothetical protein